MHRERKQPNQQSSLLRPTRRWVDTSSKISRIFKITAALGLLSFQAQVYAGSYSIDASGLPAVVKITGSNFSSSDFARVAVTDTQGSRSVYVFLSLLTPTGWVTGDYQGWATETPGRQCPASLLHYASRPVQTELSPADIELFATFINDSNSTPRSGREFIPHQGPVSQVGNSSPRASYWSCTFPPHTLAAPGLIGSTTADTGINVVVPPPGATSMCTLDSQQLNFTFESTSLNVAGLQRGASLAVNCSPGAPADYTFRLTGSNPTNGALNFGNGVSAQVRLNGIQLNANGAPYTYPQLGAGTLPLTVTLQGSASVPGVSTATGVLILESL